MPYKYNNSGRGVGIGYCNGCKTRKKLKNGFCVRCRKLGAHNNPEYQDNSTNTSGLTQEEKLKRRESRLKSGKLKGVSNSVNANVSRSNVKFNIDKNKIKNPQNQSNTPKDVNAEKWLENRREEIDEKRREAQKNGIDIPRSIF